jgi:hypothetical protein
MAVASVDFFVCATAAVDRPITKLAAVASKALFETNIG